MRKVYLPVYLIEWSDVRPYALKAAHGMKVGAHYAGIGLRHLAVWTAIGARYLWKALKWLMKLLLRGFVKLMKAIWEVLTGIVSVANPKKDEGEDEDEEDYSPATNSAAEDEDDYDASSDDEPRNLFDGED